MTRYNPRRAASVSSLVVILSLGSAQLGMADETVFKLPTVDYSADMVSESSGAARSAKVFHSGTKTRTELQSGGHAIVSIIDRGKMEAISIDPAKKSYIKIDLGKLGVGQDSAAMADYKPTLLGQETINGLATSKYAYEGTSSGDTIKGTVWLTKDSIPVRTESTVITGGQSVSATSHLDNLKVEKQDSALFEVPAGYTERQMPGPMGSHDADR